ncbi:hypothetical protein E2C01_017525 [Portunus trituberculatus]|uniref:Uncharacterized protein n=1 Tax=Portunus trituberculatus TaxID=210409 RepID=A0A5B7DTQ6_PORTR|nr:hypothetical protein [Portunus trituberculatus]
MKILGQNLSRAVTALGPVLWEKVAVGSGLGPKAGNWQQVLFFPLRAQASVIIIHLQRLTLGKGSSSISAVHQMLPAEWGWLGRGVWQVIAHGDPCEERQGCRVTAPTPSGLGWALGEEGFGPVPTQNRIIIVEYRIVKNHIVENRIVENRILENLIVENRIVKNRIVENRIVENRIMENRIVENRIVENRIIKNRIVENRIVENRIVENRIVENRIVENRIVENRIVENRNVKNRIVENCIVENCIVENHIVENRIKTLYYGGL